MLVIAGPVRIDPAKRDEVIEAAIDVMREARKLPGCISFVFSADIEDPGVLHVFQEWESPEAFESHLTTLRIEAAQLQLGSLGVRDIAVHRYAIQSVGPIA